MRKPINRRVLFALAMLSLVGGAFFACSTDSPTEPAPPGQGPGVPPPPPAGTWNITVTANPPQLQLQPPGEPVPTSSILIQVRRASDNSLPPTGATIAVAASGGTINGVASGVFTLTNGQLSLTFAPTAAGTAIVQAQLEGSTGQASIHVAAAEEVDTLVLSHVSPNVVDPAGGQAINIFGQGIREPVRVNVGGVDAEVLSVEPNRIRVRVPPRPGVPVGSTQTVSVSVTSGVGTPFQATDSLTGALTYAHGGTIIQPAIFSVTPTTGPNEGGTEVTIRGTGFQSPVQVLFESAQASLVEAEPISVTSSEIRVRTPPARSFGQGNLNQAVSITVINLESGFRFTLDAAFRYGVLIEITGITPMSGPYTGGTTVTIHGIGFQAPVAVILQDIEQQVLSVSGSQILFRTVAAGSAPGCGALSGTLTLEVVNLGMPPLDDSTATHTGFQFEGPPSPIITGVFPSTGPQAGGFDVTITGSGFENPVRVAFGGQTSPDASANLAGSQVVAEAPAFTGSFPEEDCTLDGTPGRRFVPTTVDVQVTNLVTGCVDIIPGAFTYIPTDQSCRIPPPVASFTFSPESPETGQAVNFTDTSTGGVPTSWQWTFGDGGSSTIQHPSRTYAAAGTYTVTLTVTNAGGSSSTSRQVTVSDPPSE